MTSDPSAVIEKVKAKFSDAITEASSDFDEGVVVVDPSKWMTVAAWLAKDGGFSFLSDLTCVDRLGREPRFDIVYQLLDMEAPARLTVKVPVTFGLGAEPPKSPSVTKIWPAANFPEREVFDMFGVVFEGHPNLTRILMPDGWEGHPLRKDYAIGKVPVEFKHLSPGGVE